MSDYRRKLATSNSPGLSNRSPGGWYLSKNECVPAAFYHSWDSELVAQLAQNSMLLKPDIFRSIPWTNDDIVTRAYDQGDGSTDWVASELKQAEESVRREESDKDGGWTETPMSFFCAKRHRIATINLERKKIRINNDRTVQILALSDDAPKNIYSLCVRKKHCKGHSHPGQFPGFDMLGSTHFECPATGCKFNGVYSSPVIIAACVEALNDGTRDVYLTS